jgi:hypothetical protein
MMVIDNQIIYSDREQAEQAFRRCVEQGHDLEFYSFVQGYLSALNAEQDGVKL